MRYISTRDASRTALPFSEILLKGLAPDGGLYIPQEYPQVDNAELNRLREVLANGGYPALAAEVLKYFVDDIPAEDLEAIAHRAYTAEAFGTDEIVGLDQLDGHIYIGHISEGPTAAFKDMAMQLLGELFEYELLRAGRPLTILGATSGDTGSSAEYAMRGRDNITVFMLTPAGRMTPFQQAQMYSLDDPNIFNIALDGTFDDCQDIVKAVNSDAEFKEKHSIGAVNSINFARIMAQVTYYFALYFKATSSNDQQVSFTVPTGNFGNIYAGHVAREMGLPIKNLVAATNENDILDAFFNQGSYMRRGDGTALETSSPSMDISRASNFERFIYDLLERDSEKVTELFGEKVPQGGFAFDVNEEPFTLISQYGLMAGSSTHEDRIAEIKDAFTRLDTLIDPHTADGVKVARSIEDTQTPMIVLETALPVKFAETITEAIGSFPEIPERFANVESDQRYVTDLPNDVQAVKDFIAENSLDEEQVKGS